MFCPLVEFAVSESLTVRKLAPLERVLCEELPGSDGVGQDGTGYFIVRVHFITISSGIMQNCYGIVVIAVIWIVL